MRKPSIRTVVGACWLSGLLVAVGSAAALGSEPPRIAKDVGPASAACDAFAKGSPAWTGCVGVAKAGMPDAELFYAGYWLAKNGQYAQALGYLKLANGRDERVLTYIGFATRKLGDVDGALPFYLKALAINPNYSVARAYMGEAFLSKGEPAKARAELAEIEKRCGTTCAEYADLAAHITSFEAAAARKG